LKVSFLRSLGSCCLELSVSQPYIDALNPSRDDIRDALGGFGFEQISEDAYLHVEFEILLTDAAPRNVRVVEGIPALFDVIASIASPDVIRWAARQ
jgi:hypothetical protein